MSVHVDIANEREKVALAILSDDSISATDANMIAIAQVHATLAVANAMLAVAGELEWMTNNWRRG